MGKTVEQKMLLSVALSSGVADLVALGEDCREGCDNTPENFQSSQRYQNLEEAADALESLDEIELPEGLEDTEVTVHEYVSGKKSGPTRAQRRDAAVAHLSAVASELGTRMDKLEANSDAHSTASELLDGVQELIDTAEALEFS